MDPAPVIIASSSLIALVILACAGLYGWQGWIGLRLHEIDQRRPGFEPEASLSMNARIELADLRERIRKLEAIAAGVDL